MWHCQVKTPNTRPSENGKQWVDQGKKPFFVGTDPTRLDDGDWAARNHLTKHVGHLERTCGTRDGY